MLTIDAVGNGTLRVDHLHPEQRQRLVKAGPEGDCPTCTRPLGTEYDKVRAIYNYFSEDNGFSYRLSTEQGSSGQAILDFLENKVGRLQMLVRALEQGAGKIVAMSIHESADSALVRLICDADLRRTMGRAAAEFMKPRTFAASFEHYWEVHERAARRLPPKAGGAQPSAS